MSSFSIGRLSCCSVLKSPILPFKRVGANSRITTWAHQFMRHFTPWWPLLLRLQRFTPPMLGINFSATIFQRYQLIICGPFACLSSFSSSFPSKDSPWAQPSITALAPSTTTPIYSSWVGAKPLVTCASHISSACTPCRFCLCFHFMFWSIPNWPFWWPSFMACWRCQHSFKPWKESRCLAGKGILRWCKNYLEALGLKSLLVETKISSKIKVKAEDSLGFCR